MPMSFTYYQVYLSTIKIYRWTTIIICRHQLNCSARRAEGAFTKSFGYFFI